MEGNSNAELNSSKFLKSWHLEAGYKGQLNSGCIYEVIVSPKMPTKKLKDFCPGSLLGQKSFKFLQVTSLPCFLGAS